MKRTSAVQELRRVGQFTDDHKLQRPLSELEENVKKTFDAHREQKVDRHQATPIATADVKADFAQTLMYDPTGGTFTVSLPKVSQRDHGKSIRLKNISTSATAITLQPATGQLVDGSATDTVSGSKLATHLYCDGIGWWKV